MDALTNCNVCDAKYDILKSAGTCAWSFLNISSLETDLFLIKLQHIDMYHQPIISMIQPQSRSKKQLKALLWPTFPGCVHACKAYYVWCFSWGTHSIPLFLLPLTVTRPAWGGVPSNKTFIPRETVCPAPATTLALTPGALLKLATEI